MLPEPPVWPFFALIVDVAFWLLVLSRRSPSRATPRAGTAKAKHNL